MTIGVGVEGPSDRDFWNKVLHKHFRRFQFDIRNMKSRAKLIESTPTLLESFKNLHYRAGFILVDRNDSRCPTEVLGEFDAHVQLEAKRPINQRYLHICIAIRELEAWFLADEAGINAVLTKSEYGASSETGLVSAEGMLKTLWQKNFGKGVAINKIEFARMMAPKFDPGCALNRSSSFKHFWGRLRAACR